VSKVLIYGNTRQRTSTITKYPQPAQHTIQAVAMNFLE